MSYSARSAFPTWRRGRRSKSHELHEHDPERVPEVSDMRRRLHESVGLFGIRWEGGGRVEPARMGTGPVALRRARPERGGGGPGGAEKRGFPPARGGGGGG